MAYNYSDNDTNYKNPLNSKLFENGFENDVTPLDEYNLNLILAGIKQVHDIIKKSESSLNSEIKKEVGLLNNSITELDARLSNSISTNAMSIDAHTTSINTITEQLNSLADKEVVEKYPSISVTVKDLDNASIEFSKNKSFEIGTTINPKVIVKFDPGKYKYPPTDTNVEYSYHNVNINGEDFSLLPTSNENEFTVNIGQLTLGDTKLKIKTDVSYSEGSIPNNNLNVPYEDGKITAGALENIIEVSSYKQGCFYGAISEDISSGNITPSMIRGLSKTNAAYTKGSIVLNVPVGANAIIIACPEGKVGPTSVYNTKVNAEMWNEGNFNINNPLSLEVGGADSTSTWTGEYSSLYNVWVYVPAYPYGDEATLRITLG